MRKNYSSSSWILDVHEWILIMLHETPWTEEVKGSHVFRSIEHYKDAEVEGLHWLLPVHSDTQPRKKGREKKTRILLLGVALCRVLPWASGDGEVMVRWWWGDGEQNDSLLHSGHPSPSIPDDYDAWDRKKKRMRVFLWGTFSFLLLCV